MTQSPAAGTPTPPIELTGGAANATARLHATRVEVDDTVLARLRDVCADVSTEPATLAEASRDWWPLAMTWALEGQVAGLADVVARPGDAGEVSDVLRVANDARIPVTAAAGRSGVCGASVPVHGGIVLDLTALTGIVDVDDTSLVLDVHAGTFGNLLEDELRATYDKTLGHWPQSIDLSTVGGWLACRSAGQYSNRYGKIEDIVVGLDVVLADGRQITTGGVPRQAVGPDLNQMFVGSEGTLGIITGARLKVHDAPQHEDKSAWGFDDFPTALDFLRRVARRGGSPAVLRLYDATEAERSYQTGDVNVVLARDEGDPATVEASMRVVADEAKALGAHSMDATLVDRWMAHRNDVSALEALISKGFVVDTMEVSGLWAALPRIYDETIAALKSVPGTLAASAHQSHSYLDGGCLYFTFAGRVEPDDKDRFYRAIWDAGQRAVLANGGALSHHHGVGLNRSRFVQEALGPAFEVLAALKSALDPNGILNPGKLGLASPFGATGF
ncbi:MAG: alkyldihydroxyacetonephosphate synthase [Acidimicrobiaceae bacterium]